MYKNGTNLFKFYSKFKIEALWYHKLHWDWYGTPTYASSAEENKYNN